MQIIIVGFLQSIGSGILIGFVYALLGLSIVIIFKASQAFNFAVGQFLVIGAFLFYTLFASLMLPFLIAFPLGLLIAGLVGAAIERLTIKPLIGRDPIFMTKATLGLFFLLSASVQFVLKYIGSSGWSPLNMPDITFKTSRLFFLSEQIWAGLLSVLTFGLVILFLLHTRLGLAIRAVSESQIIASAFGINARFILMITWSISSVCVAVAGIMISNFGVFSASLAQVGFRAIPVVLVGGMDSVRGALSAGIIIGVFESIVSSYIEPLGLIGFKDVAAYILLLIMLFIRPHGLFGTVRIERI
ncbi:MAG: branched-chain amino acid ABC transporter permease [Desulfobacterales bacterium]|nr:branched-chain amino acid ABC transporter permease [Desulfobacterales bacterium]